MGLDMYLSKKLYLWQNKRGDLKITGLPVQVKPREIKQIEAEAGYWRKANAIHQWFVDNVQDGEDNCAEYYVDREKIKELLTLVKRVLAKPELADELLPAQAGFFFGSTEYDEYYFDQLKETRKILQKALREPEDWEFYYQSSW